MNGIIEETKNDLIGVARYYWKMICMDVKWIEANIKGSISLILFGVWVWWSISTVDLILATNRFSVVPRLLITMLIAASGTLVLLKALVYTKMIKED